MRRRSEASTDRAVRGTAQRAIWTQDDGAALGAERIVRARMPRCGATRAIGATRLAASQRLANSEQDSQLHVLEATDSQEW